MWGFAAIDQMFLLGYLTGCLVTGAACYYFLKQEQKKSGVEDC